MIPISKPIKPPKLNNIIPLKCPEWLPDNARVIWNEIYPRISDVCNEKDIEQLCNLCIALSQAREAAQYIETNGMVYQLAKNTGYAPNGDQVPGNELPDILIDYKSFLHNDYNFKHPSCWVAKVQDRLDAEFYFTGIPENNTKTISLVQKDTAELIKEIGNQYNAIEKNLTVAFNSIEFKTIKLCDLLTEISIKEKIDANKNYKLLGVRWWGGGAFIREEKNGSSIKSTSIYRVSANLIIYNRLFAFRGSFAVLEQQHDGCYVSNEFPTFKVNDGIEEPLYVSKYIVHCLNSPQYLSIVDKLSTGSTKKSRNRFYQKQFLSFELKIPVKTEDLISIVELMDNAVALRFKQELLISKFKDLQETISYMIPSPY